MRLPLFSKRSTAIFQQGKRLRSSSPENCQMVHVEKDLTLLLERECTSELSALGYIWGALFFSVKSQ